MKSMAQTLRSAFQRTFRRENRRASLRRGRLERIPGFESQILGNARDLTIYLPPGYDEREERRYPVLYMQDGQNLFDPERAFVPGNHWHLAESADEAIGGADADAVIIVGIDHAGTARIDEYTPTRSEAKKGGGKAADYGRMLVEELKPMIDARFHTRADREHTAIGGSSLGGLVSLFLVLTRPDVFGRAAVMSPSVWWDNRAILGFVDQFQGDKPLIWVDIGGREGKEALTDARALRDRLLAKGWNQSNFRFHEDRRADHSERAWAARARTVLEFLFPPE
jgi:predicted alpha/beta superfamily hydrolase